MHTRRWWAKVKIYQEIVTISTSETKSNTGKCALDVWQPSHGGKLMDSDERYDHEGQRPGNST